MGQCKEPGCRAGVIAGEEYCFFHHPDYAAERKAAQAKGGRNSKRVLNRKAIAGLDLEQLSDLNRLLAQLVGGVVTGAVSPTVCKSAGYLVRSIALVRETTELEDRIARIEEKIEKIGGARWG